MTQAERPAGVMAPMIEQDVLSQEIARRSLSIAIQEAIIIATKKGLQGQYVIRTLEDCLKAEVSINQTSKSFARMIEA